MRALSELGFRRGRAGACIFRHAERRISLTVHGDDFLNTGAASELDLFEGALLGKFDGKEKGCLRFEGDELRVLNRVIRCTRAAM